MESVDAAAVVHALNRLLKRFAEVGWVDSSAITADGRLHINYTEKGLARMRQLRDVLIGELHVALKFDEFQALMGLLLRLDIISPNSDG